MYKPTACQHSTARHDQIAQKQM